jgi:hypothetical protein
MEELQKRMYFFVPYNISPIQQAIQAGHAVEQYGHKHKDDPDYIDYVENWKTWVILNGGTTNSTIELGSNPRKDDNPYVGSLDNIAHQIIKNKISYAIFQEPDLNNALTAVCFLADERVFNYEKYPDFEMYILSQDFPDGTPEKENSFLISRWPREELIEMYQSVYLRWIKMLGGPKNVFLRDLLKGKKLA